MTEPDAVFRQVADAVQRGQRGDRQAARRQLAELWDHIGPAGDPLHRVAVAHAMADVQDDPADELAWDQRALHAAAKVTGDRAAQAGLAVPAAGLYPSLHLNLGEAHRKVGDTAAARRHLELGLAAAKLLSDDGYIAMITGALNRLGDRLADT